MIIIATGGLAQAGKTTFCENVDDHISHTHQHLAVERLSFAGPIRKALSALCITKADHPAMYRQMAQYIGTDALRAAYPDWWVVLMNEQFKRVLADETDIREMSGKPLEIVVLIDDVRFQNEVDLIHRWGGKTVFVDASRRLPPPSEEWQKHSSEKLALDYMDIEADLPDETFDISLTNNGTKEAFTLVSNTTYPELL